MADEDFEMYLQGAEDGSVEIICTRRSCMMKGHATSWNPEGLWLVDVADLSFHPAPAEVQKAWDAHLREKHEAA